MTMSIAAIRRAVTPPSFPVRFRRFEERIGILGFAAALLFASTHVLLAHQFKSGSIEVDHPWSRATPQGAKVAAGYFVIRNEGSTPDRLVSVTADISGKAEIHEMAVNAEGVMTMRPIDGGVEIPPGGEVAFKPGGLHAMFMELKGAVKEGTPFSGTLTFTQAGDIPVEFAVDAIGGAHSDDHSN